MKIKLSIIVLVYVVIVCCKETKPIDLKAGIMNIESIEILKGLKNIDPSKRNLVKIGELDKESIDLLQMFFNVAKKRKMSFILSQYYLRLSNEISNVKNIGVAIKSDGTLVGLDVTGDASMTSVRSLHDILYCKDPQINKALLDKLLSYDKEWIKRSHLDK